MLKSLILASLAAVLAVFVITLVASAIGAIASEYDDILISLLIAGVAAVVALFAVVVFAIPLHFVLLRLNRQRVVWYVLASIVLSFLFVYALKPFGLDSAADLLQQALFCSLCGGVAAVVFWYIAVHRAGVRVAM